MAAEVGNCQNYEARWYWDVKQERCRQFYYGGCDGTDNNFVDESACLARCAGKCVCPLMTHYAFIVYEIFIHLRI